MLLACHFQKFTKVRVKYVAKCPGFPNHKVKYLGHHQLLYRKGARLGCLLKCRPFDLNFIVF